MRWIFVAVLLFALAKAAYGEDICPSKSASFGFCVKAELMDHAFQAKDRTELESIIRKDCATEMKEFAECDGIDKKDSVNEYLAREVDFFKKDRPKAVAHLKTSDSEQEDSVTN